MSCRICSFLWNQASWFNHDCFFSSFIIRFSGKVSHSIDQPNRRNSLSSLSQSLQGRRMTLEFISQDAKQADITTSSSNNTILTIVRQSLSDVTGTRQCLAKDKQFFSLRYSGIVWRSKAFTPQNRISKLNQIQIVKQHLLHKILPQDLLDKSW